MKKLILICSLIALTACSQSPQQGVKSYQNHAAALSFNYPGDWQVQAQPANAGDIPLDFYASRNDGAANINVIANEVPPELWDKIKLQEIKASLIQTAQAEMPTIKILPGARPLGNSADIGHFSTQLDSDGKSMYQHTYFYWNQPYFIQVTLTTSLPDDPQINATFDSLKIQPGIPQS